jgi:hypothetical protein
MSQDSNARSLLSALIGTGFLNEDGTLSERGKRIRGGENTDDYRAANLEAIMQLLGEERVASIRAGILNAESLPGNLAVAFNVGHSMVSKALGGIRWLAAEAGEEAIVSATTKMRPTTNGKSGSNAKVTGRRPQSKVDHPVVLPLASHPTLTERQGTDVSLSNPLLGSGVLSVIIDSNWELEDARQMFLGFR